MSIEAFLEYGEPDERYELARGVPVKMPSPAVLHQVICFAFAGHLSRAVARFGLPYTVTAIGLQTEDLTVRIPDILVCYQADIEANIAGKNEGLARLGQEVALVVEVVSQNWRDDYRDKRREYAQRGVPEYLIIDPYRERIIVNHAPDTAQGRYQREVAYGKGEALRLASIPGLTLSVDRVLAGETLEDALAKDVQQLQTEQARAEAERQVRQLLEEELNRLRAQLGRGGDTSP